MGLVFRASERVGSDAAEALGLRTRLKVTRCRRGPMPSACPRWGESPRKLFLSFCTVCSCLCSGLVWHQTWRGCKCVAGFDVHGYGGVVHTHTTEKREKGQCRRSCGFLQSVSSRRRAFNTPDFLRGRSPPRLRGLPCCSPWSTGTWSCLEWFSAGLWFAHVVRSLPDISRIPLGCNDGFFVPPRSWTRCFSVGRT